MLLLFVCLGFLSCEEVVDIDLNTAESKLVIDATIKNISYNCIRITKTTGYFEENIPFVDNAEVSIIDANGNNYNFEHSEQGLYCGEFLPEANIDYTLVVVYDNDVYSSTTQLVSTVEIDFIEQNNNGGFSGEDIEMKVFFSDPVEEDNFYFLEFESSDVNIFDARSDEFFDGNTIFFTFSDEKLEAGDEVNITLNGVNGSAYNYLFTLLQQTNSTNGPFGTQPATVRGNIVNETVPDDFPYGYFRISEVSAVNITVQ